MSKSLGNFITARDLLEQGIAGEAIRYTLLSAHYRQPLDWTEQGLESAKKSLDKFYKILDELKNVADIDAAIPDEMMDALCDELNTPKAYAVLNALAKTAAETKTPADKAAFKAGANILGFLTADPAVWLAQDIVASGVDEAWVDGLLAERIDAKKSKNFARADEIRKILADKNIVIEDSAAGSTWRMGTL